MLSKSDREASWLLLQLAEQGRPIEQAAQFLASMLVSSDMNVEESADLVAQIVQRTGQLFRDHSQIWPGLLPGGAGPYFDDVVTPVCDPISKAQWDALATAERSLYRDDPGCHGYTDVNVREEPHPVLAKVWGHVEDNLAGTHPEWEIANPDYRLRLIASRVARTFALMAFGPEFLLR